MAVALKQNKLPEDVLIVILSFCPGSFLTNTAPLVSRKWRELCQRKTLWRIKCQRDRVTVPSKHIFQREQFVIPVFRW